MTSRAAQGPRTSLSWDLILEDDTEELTAQPLSQPGVLDDGQLEALTAQRCVVVGVDGTAHALDDHQVGTTLPHQHGQPLVQAALGRKEAVREVQARALSPALSHTLPTAKGSDPDPANFVSPESSLLPRQPVRQPPSQDLGIKALGTHGSCALISTRWLVLKTGPS